VLFLAGNGELEKEYQKSVTRSSPNTALTQNLETPASSFDSINRITIMPGGNIQRINYQTKLAVSVLIADFPRSWNDSNLRDCLNFRIKRITSTKSNAIVICERIENGEDNQYYVELRTSAERDGLLKLNDTKITSGDHVIWPRIETWYQEPSLASPSHQLQRCSSNEASKQRQHHHRQQKNGNYLRNSERDLNADNGYDRPSKRPKIPLSPSRKSHENTSASVSTHVRRHEPHSPKRLAAFSATHNQSPRNGRKPSIITSRKSSTDMTNCKVYLTKNPGGVSPAEFQDYLNRQLKVLNLAGVSDDAGGENTGIKPSILNCYESPTSSIYDGWILETKTEKIVDAIINDVSGKLLLAGTRLYFQRHPDFSRDRRGMPPLSLSLHSSSKEDTNGKQQLISSPSSFPSWDNKECVAACLSKIPDSMSLQDISSFVNTFMKKSGLFDRDIIIASQHVGNQRACVFLCFSADAVRGIIDELNGVSLKSVKLEFCHHKFMTQQYHTTYDQTNNESEKKGSIPCMKASTSSLKDTASNPSPSLRNMNTSQTSLPTLKSNEASRNIDVTITSRFVFLSSRKNNTICLPKVMSLLNEAIEGSYVGRCAIVGAECYNSSRYRLETDTVETASELVKLSGIVYNSTVELILKKDEDNSRKASSLATKKDSTQLKDKNDNLTKQVLKLLKENKDLKKQNDILARKNLGVKVERIGSGSHKKPIELEDSSDEEDEDMSSCQNDEKAQSDASEFEKLQAEKNQLEKDFVAVKDACKEFERQIENAKTVNDGYERRLFDLHGSWTEQTTQIQEQQDVIESLKVGQEQESAEKESLKSQLQVTKERYQDMTDALTMSTRMIQEEIAVRKTMALSLVKLRKAKKRAEKELKAYTNLSTSVKPEDKYDV